ncbi:MAG TPA: pyruvate carboxyltransferase [Clostridia bacterium]|nr:pyruvate carboxyltransferase [Clostridia bacterium]
MTKYKTENWFTSPWNFYKDVTENINFSDNIKLHDITLRDGEQQAGVFFNPSEKIRLVEKMNEMGIHRIEAGMPAVSKQNKDIIKKICKKNLDLDIFAFSRCMKEDVKHAVDCGVDGIVIEIPSSEHIIKTAYKWPLEKAINLAIEATEYAHKQGLYVVFFPIDGSRAEMNWFIDLIKKVANEGHMDALGLVDTFGACSPHSIPFLVNKIKEEIDKPLEAHFHNDFGLGTANTLMALASGVEVAHTTISGIGERAGNVAYEELATALLTMYNIDLNLEYNKMYELSQFMRNAADIPLANNQAIIGNTLFNIESGIIASWYKNCENNNPLELTPIKPEFVGQKAQVVLGKNSGIDSIKLYLDKLDIDSTEKEELKILEIVKKESSKNEKLLSEKEFLNIVKQVIN